MGKQKIKEKFLQYLTDMVNDFDYSNYDGFVLDNNLCLDEAEYLSELVCCVKVVET